MDPEVGTPTGHPHYEVDETSAYFLPAFQPSFGPSKTPSSLTSSSLPSNQRLNKIWFIRRWRSMARIFQVYLIGLVVAVVLITVIITANGGSFSPFQKYTDPSDPKVMKEKMEQFLKQVQARRLANGDPGDSNLSREKYLTISGKFDKPPLKKPSEDSNNAGEEEDENVNNYNNNNHNNDKPRLPPRLPIPRIIPAKENRMSQAQPLPKPRQSKNDKNVEEEAGDTGKNKVTDGVNANDVITDFDYKLFNVIDPATELSYKADLKSQTGNLTDDQIAVIDAFKHSWAAYEKYAYGADHLKPISRSSEDWFHTGLTIIDSLDTMLLMGSKLESEYNKAVDWVQRHLSFDQYREVNCFEATIRLLGGLLSAFHLTRDPTLLGKSVDLGDRLMGCYNSPSKVIPYSDVNLRTKVPKPPQWSVESSLSEVSSIQIEFRDLARLIKDPKFETVSFATSQHIHSYVHGRGDPLLPMYINPENAMFKPSTITLGARADSYYEYLLKQFLQTGHTWLRDDYCDAVDAIRTRLTRITNGPLKLTYIAELSRGSDIIPKMDHLVCFLPGTLALGYYHYSKQPTLYRGHLQNEEQNVPPGENRVKPEQGANAMPLEESSTLSNSLPSNGPNNIVLDDRFADHLEFAEELARTCYFTYNTTATGLAPEITHFGINPGDDEIYIKPLDRHNLLRPEYVESLFYLYHITGKPTYRDQGRKILESFNKYTKIPAGGYSSISDVTNPSHVGLRDKMESFWTAETLKYLYLLFSDDKALISKMLDNYLFNTEAHLIPLRLP